MIVCSCNVLSDDDVRYAVEAERTRSTSRIYGCLGCSVQCGRCARTIRRIMDEALGNASSILPVDESEAHRLYERRSRAAEMRRDGGSES